MKRLDKWLVEQGYASSRDKAKVLIQSHSVKINEKICSNPSFEINDTDNVSVDSNQIEKYVSRSAHKLIAALDHFKIKVEAKLALDVGMSTGGFTQVLLERGAKKVFGVDVGHDQLHSKIKNDPRVESFEGVNVKEGLPFKTLFDLIVVDVSFISILKILPSLIPNIIAKGTILFLVKPQFEQIDQTKKMILSEHESLAVAENCRDAMIKQNMKCSELFLVPLKGKDGNQEYFIKCDF